MEGGAGSRYGSAFFAKFASNETVMLIAVLHECSIAGLIFEKYNLNGLGLRELQKQCTCDTGHF